MKSKVTWIAAIGGLAAAVFLSGCSTTGGAFGKLQTADEVAARKYAGETGVTVLKTGRNWLGIPDARKTVVAVPEGYDLICDKWYEGKLIDVTRIQETWRIAPKAGTLAAGVDTGPVAPVDLVAAGISDLQATVAGMTNAPPAGQDVGSLLEAIGGAGK